MKARFVIQRHEDETGRWAYIDSCPHGLDLGAIHLGPNFIQGDKWGKITWQWKDLGNGKCEISPSILAKSIHNGEDCHFGPGTFDFIWLEEGELRNVEPFLSRYNEWVKSLGD